MALRSMTGMGLGEASLQDGIVKVELRAVNHRHLDVRVRATPELADATPLVEDTVRAACGRGRVEASLRYEGPTGTGLRYELARARATYAFLQRLRDELAPGQEIPVSVLAQIPGALGNGGSFDPEERDHATREATLQATAALDAMRLREGSELAADLEARLSSLERSASSIEERRPALIEAARERIRRRISKLLEGSDLALDPARLTQEIAWFADRSDISEELTRLSSHVAQFRAIAAAAGPGTGKRLDFLLQEMGREANTTGAKANDAAIAHAVVEIKAELERLREQVQNVL